MSQVHQEFEARRSPLSPMTRYKLTERALRWDDDVGRSGTIAYADITEVRLRHDPSRIMSRRYLCLLRTRNGEKLTIPSLSFRGMGSYENKGPEYWRFVEALHDGLIDRGKNVRYRAGDHPLMFWTCMAIVVSVTAIVVAVAFKSFSTQGVEGLIIIGMMSVAMAYAGYDYLSKGWPAAYRPDGPPARVLPPPPED